MTADPFDPAAISPETARFNADLEAELAALPKPWEVDVNIIREMRARGEGIFPPAGPREGSVWQEIPGAPGGTGRVRLSPAPGRPRGTYLHIHGGGWTFNAADQYDRFNQRIAAATGARVVSVAYRLAPENRWPAPLDDCVAAAQWALESDDGPVVIGGESAGAHLAAATLLTLRARGRLDRIAGAVFAYGIFDLAGTPSMRAWGSRFLVLSTPIVDWFVGNLMADGPLSDPLASPLRADLAGLPPALFQCGTMDPLLDDTLFMAARWRAAGNAAETGIAPGGVHAYDQFPLAIAEEALARRERFVADRLAG